MEATQKPKIDLPYGSAMRLLGIYPKNFKLTYLRDICMLGFISILVSITKSRTQPRHLSIEKWIGKFTHVPRSVCRKMNAMAVNYIKWINSVSRKLSTDVFSHLWF